MTIGGAGHVTADWLRRCHVTPGGLLKHKKEQETDKLCQCRRRNQ
jgi:hypothetical protein